MCIADQRLGGPDEEEVSSMQTRTVAPPQWTRLFDSFTRIYQGSSATLEVLSADLGAQLEVEDLPFLGISNDDSGMELLFETRDGSHLTHVVSKPRQVQIEERDDGTVAALQIGSETDPPLVLRLHAPLPARLLATRD
jgi:hypothetical protein